MIMKRPKIAQILKLAKPFRACFLKQFSAEITISALLWGGFAVP